jgi:hypothetical protein
MSPERARAGERLSIMKTQLAALPLCVTKLAVVQGLEVHRLIGAMNASLNDGLSLVEEQGRIGNARIKAKAGTVANAETVTYKYEGKRCAPLDFKAFSDSMARVEKQFPSVALAEFPAQFSEWLAKFTKGKGAEAKSEAKPQAKAQAIAA